MLSCYRSKAISNWIDDLWNLSSENEACYAVTVVRVRGSAPREVGAKMLVTEKQTIGSIGGGQLEHQCSRIAFDGLHAQSVQTELPAIRRFPLGSNCGQCCGGVVDVMFERIEFSAANWLCTLRTMYTERKLGVLATDVSDPERKFIVTEARCSAFDPTPECPAEIVVAARQLMASGASAALVDGHLLETVCRGGFSVAIFGAGHVGAATVEILSRLDCDIRWIDSRRGIFPAQSPANVTTLETAEPAREVAVMPPDSQFLIMTHSHALDQQICEHVLQREDFAYCGLIGSLSKRRNFERRLRKQGLSEARLSKLTCPIGIPGIDSKKPSDIAVSIAAELLQRRTAVTTAENVVPQKPQLLKNVL